MNLFVVIPVLALLAALLYGLSKWQRKIDEVQRERVLADLREAEDRGTARPIAQHPSIDVQACIGCGSCVAACPEEGVLGMVDGVARVIHGARCVGHGRCADACPVSAVVVGLGDVSQRTDIPVLSEQLETTVPGIYIAGELGGFSLIRNAVKQGVSAVNTIAASLRATPNPPEESPPLDLLVVGSGPAGIAASLRATELGLRYATIDQQDIGGTVRKYPRRKLTLTGPLELPIVGRLKRTEYRKEELIALWEEIIAQHQLKIRSGMKLNEVARHGDVLVAQTSGGVIRARRILLALGKRGTPRKLGVPGEQLDKVFYQIADTATYQQQHLLVVGGGDSAIEAATGLANQRGNVVTLSYRRPNFFRLKARNEKRIEEYVAKGKLRVIHESTVESIDDERVVLSVTENGVTRQVPLRNDHVFVFAGGEPPYELLQQMGVRFGGEQPALAEAKR